MSEKHQHEKPREKEAVEEAKSSSKEQELVEQLQRLQAEFENYKKRSEKENEEFRCAATSNLLKELLPIMDHFELALTTLPPESNESQFAKGIELIYGQLQELLDSHAVRQIEALNQPFDPRLHEALLTEERDDVQKNTVTAVLQKGYLLGDKLLRTAKVKVAKRKNEKEKEEKNSSVQTT